MSADFELGLLRKEIDSIDTQILDLLARRRDVVENVTKTKLAHKIPVYIAGRENDKVTAFRDAALARGLDPEWAEDFLRMIMSSSRANQSLSSFPSATKAPMKWVFVGGGGGMGRLYAQMAIRTGHEVGVIEKGDWKMASHILRNAHVVVVTVPINKTEEIIQRVSPLLTNEQILCDFTSVKSQFINAMLESHTGPVLGLHPMHGPDVPNLSKQLMVACPARFPEKSDWVLQQFGLWGLRIKEADPVQHDRAMNLVQGLRHFVALLHASFMNSNDMKPEDMLDYSSPIYRAELMMTGRIFAQDAALYADIVFSDDERIEMLSQFLEHHNALAEMVKKRDKKAFIQEFEEATEFFGDFADTALEESGYLINRLADRFG